LDTGRAVYFSENFCNMVGHFSVEKFEERDGYTTVAAIRVSHCVLVLSNIFLSATPTRTANPFTV
jgi:hypothetical protein